MGRSHPLAIGTIYICAMSLARRLLLGASRSAWLARQLSDRRFLRRAVRRFLPGEDLDAALAAAAALERAGVGSVVTQLGEQVTSLEEAARVRDHYLDVLEHIRRRRLPTELSVKLTHLGLDLDREVCRDHLAALVTRANATGSGVWIDMEESRYVDATLELYRRVRTPGTRVGVCLQAYLRRTPTDLAALLPLGPAIRLVKGAYNEPASLAFPRKHDVDECYVELADRLLAEAAQGRARVVFGTHNRRLIARIRTDATRHGASPASYEVHMLYGIAVAEQRTLATQGVRLRVLVSYGTHWFPWYMRRLAERPANLWFVVKNLV